jgi:hypothetical protein
MSAICRIYYTVDSRLKDLPVQDGNLIFSHDTRRVYLDMAGIRTEYSSIQIVSTESARQSIVAPTESFYFVEDTNVLWRYKAGWVQVTPDNIEPLFFGGFDSFPKEGNENVLYVDDDVIYRWEPSLGEYVVASNATSWKTI